MVGREPLGLGGVNVFAPNREVSMYTFVLSIGLGAAIAGPSRNPHRPPTAEGIVELDEDDFVDLTVSGQSVGPSHAYTVTRGMASFTSMIVLRRDFNERIAASIDEIR